MDFEWSDQQVAYRVKVQEFLAQHLPQDWGRLSNAFDTSSEFVERFARDFCPKLATAGLLVPHWPVEYGGKGLDSWYHWILNEEMFAIGEPRCYQYMSVNWAGPGIMSFGTEKQKREHLPSIASGELFYCQGFSEPNAGSDLPALKTRAERCEAGFRITGSKIWTSAASFADYCILLARTGGEGRRGISIFIVPMGSPGITVRVIKGTQGARSFHEMFFDGVLVPEDAILGEVDRGWNVVGAILHNERIGAPRYALTMNGLSHALDLLDTAGRLEDPGVRLDAALAKAACEAARLQCYGVIDSRVKGKAPSADTNLARYAMVAADRLVADFIAEYLSGVLVSGADPLLSAAFRRANSSGIAAGAAEIQLNTIAKGHLDLPKG